MPKQGNVFVMHHVSRLELTSSGLIIYKTTRFFRFFCSLEGEEPWLWLHQKCFQRPAVLHSSLKFTQLPHIPEHRNRHTFHKIYLHQSDLNWCYSSKTKFLSNVSSQSKLNLQHQSPILRSQVSFKIHAASAQWAEVYSLRFILPFLREDLYGLPYPASWGHFTDILQPEICWVSTFSGSVEKFSAATCQAGPDGWRHMSKALASKELKSHCLLRAPSPKETEQNFLNNIELEVLHRESQPSTEHWNNSLKAQL